MPFQPPALPDSALPVPPHRSLARGEKGSITVFSLMMLISMIGVGGLAVDAMHFEHERMAMQDAVDRCTLMATIVQNRIDGGAITGLTAAEAADDCMNTSRIGSSGLDTPDVDTENSERSVELTGNYSFDSLFPFATGLTDASYDVVSRSKQKLPKLEMSIILDVGAGTSAYYTGSASQKILTPFITFLNTVAAPDSGKKVSYNIIPYSRSVNLGTDLLSRFNEMNPHTFTNSNLRTCLNLPNTAYDSLSISTTDAIPVAWPISLGVLPSPADKPTYLSLTSSRLTSLLTAQSSSSASSGMCPLLKTASPATNTHTVSLGLQDKTTYTAKINSITGGVAGTETSSPSIGLKWGLAALDSSLQSVFTGLIGSSLAPAQVAGRPLAYGSSDNLKIAVMFMASPFTYATGTSLTHREMKPEFTGNTLSPIWRTPEAATSTVPIILSIYHADQPGTNKYYVNNTTESWSATPYKYPTGAAAVQMTWKQVFDMLPLYYVIQQLYMRPYAATNPTTYGWTPMADYFTTATPTKAEQIQDFLAMCSLAKAQGVLIYTLYGPLVINDADSLEAAKSCATSVSHATRIAVATTARDTVATALRIIASNIAQLTLTQ